MDVSSSVDTILSRKCNRRLLIGILTGAAFGVGVGFTVHALWQRLLQLYGRKSRDTTLDDLSIQLNDIKSELDEVRKLLQPNAPLSIEPMNGLPFFYQPTDENDEFFDAVTDTNSFHTAISDAYARGKRARIGPRVPENILQEMDQMAEQALGDCSDAAQSATITDGSGFIRRAAAGDDYTLGVRCYSQALIYNSQYRRSPEFLWRFSRAIFLNGESALSRQTVSDQELDAPLSDVEGQSDAASLNSHLAPLVSLDPRDLNDMAYATASRRELMQTGLVVARRALALALCVNRLAASCDADQLSDAGDIRQIDQHELASIYKWLAIYVGVASEFGGIKQKLTYGHEFKELIEQAIALNPLDPVCHHLKGRWCYEVYNIGWIERQIASRLFGKPPTASLEEAEKSLNECERVRPGFYSANMLYLAKCCLSRCDYSTASTWLANAKRLIDQDRLPPPFLDSSAVTEEVNNLLVKYNGYSELPIS